MGGRLIAALPSSRWEGAVLDSRQVAGGELFFALPGEETDGHRFVAQALSRGAAAAVVARPVAAEGPLIEVADTFRALHDLTRWARRSVPRHLAAVTGSAGKTTTKELLAAMLEERYRVGRSPGNLNNTYGFPVALLGIADDAEWMVAEMGMSVPGELAQVSRLGLPEVAVFTNVRPAHLAAFGTLRAVARAKAELLEGLDPRGLVVANADDPEVLWIAGLHRGPVVTYGLEADDADVRAVDLAPAHPVGTRFRLLARRYEVEEWIELGLHGRYNVENCLAAAAAALAIGISAEEIAAAAGAARPEPGRGEVLALAGGATLVDDSYNSNPAAVAQALEAAAALPGSRRWAVLGDMLELGADAPRFHRGAGRGAAAAGFDPVFGVGELSRELVAAAAEEGAAVAWWATAGEAAAALPEPRAGDVILVKGSRGVGLERVAAALVAAGGGRG
ncbi:MAG: UDP-N-acetylmuramoyl-tripeptide--D-alanyl-D-alanine ligase [Acidobacteriota bacterium]|nr:UDP-N-acetylmuramoyl-tripeptide--D-alanyl-D-alanine ligase [Acidobacteriota bacterium]MDH3522003.1 UDP-N-acetylmuramoyl-tripeptide--D-alanyl-D-alanine ligase [Acidobacteriota bacterium]